MENEKSVSVIGLDVTDSIKLVEIRESDASDIFVTIDTQRKYLGEWLPFVEFTQSIADTQSFIADVRSVSAAKGDYVFAIRYENNFAGLIGFKDTDKGNRKTEIGYWLSEPFQKKGIVTRCVQALLKYAYEELGHNRVQIKCAVGNMKSSRIPEKLGFTFEGVEREGELKADGTYRDVKVYSMLKREF